MADGKPGRPGVDVPANSIAARLKLVQARSDIETDGQFADIAGVVRSTMSAYLNGHKKPSLRILHRIAERTGTDVNWLRYGDLPTPEERSQNLVDILRTAEQNAPFRIDKVPRDFGARHEEFDMVAIDQLAMVIRRIALWRGRSTDPDFVVRFAVRLQDEVIDAVDMLPHR